MKRLIILALLLAPLASAQTGWEDQDRDMQVLQTPSTFTATSTGAEGDVLEIQFDADEVQVDVAFATANETQNFIWQLGAVVEYQDHDFDGRLSAGDDILQRFDAASLEGTMQVEGDGPYAVRATYPLVGQPPEDPLDATPAPAGTLTFAIRVTAQTFGAHSPTSIPVEVTISDFPFSSSNSDVAYEGALISLGSLRHSEYGPFSDLGISAGLAAGWEPQASTPTGPVLVDTVQTEVRPEADLGIVGLTFSVGHESDFSHGGTIQAHKFEPTFIPIPDALQPLGNALLFTSTLVIGAVVIGAPMWWRTRSR